MKDVPILVIEDNPDDVLIIDRLLKKAGYSQVTFAGDGEEGIRKTEEVRPALVIVDTLLPDMNGFELCRRLRNCKGERFKIILTTGSVDAVDAARARDAGADDYVVKTEDFSLLIEAARQIL